MNGVETGEYSGLVTNLVSCPLTDKYTFVLTVSPLSTVPKFASEGETPMDWAETDADITANKKATESCFFTLTAVLLRI